MRIALFTGMALSLLSTAAMADVYSVTVTNNLSEELFAPIVLTDVSNDSQLFTMGYVTEAAEGQILTGDPKTVVEALGADKVTVGHGEDGPPGVLLAPGKSVKFEIDTNASALRVLAMIAPTMVPDNYVSAIVDLSATDSATVDLDRFDIGHDEGSKQNMKTAEAVGTITISKM